MTPSICNPMTHLNINDIKETMKKLHAGFTLVELLITMTIVGILLSIALPSFQSFILSNRLTTQANTLIGAINLTRSEAIKRGITMSLCSSTDQATCTASSWESGWIILDPGNNEVIRIYDSLKGDNTLSNAESSTTLQFSADGFFVGSATTFTLCNNGITGEQGRQIVINATGRPNAVSPYPTCS